MDNATHDDAPRIKNHVRPWDPDGQAALRAMPANTRDEVEALVHAALELLDATDLRAGLRIEWNGRFTARMGDALYRKTGGSRLRFSVPLWPRADEDQRRSTVVHEVCHLVDGLRNGRPDGHAYGWKCIMSEAGFHASRTHRVDRAGLRRTVKAHCGCREHDLGAGRAAAIRSGRRTYTCRACGTELALGPKPRTEEEEIARLLGLPPKARQAVLEAEAQAQRVRDQRRAAAQAPSRAQEEAVDVTTNAAGQTGWRW